MEIYIWIAVYIKNAVFGIITVCDFIKLARVDKKRISTHELNLFIECFKVINSAILMLPVHHRM